MRKMTWLALFAVLALVLSAAAQDADKAAGAPKLQVPEVNFDFGYIPQISKVGHSFVLQNVGSSDLKILKVKPGCGCTQAPLAKDLVGPGDSTTVELIFTSKRQYRGRLNKSAAVTTNDDTYGTLRLRFSATINESPDSVGPVQLAPWSVMYNPQERGRSMSVDVKNVSDKPLDLELVSVPDKFIHLEFPTGKLSPGETRTIKVYINDDVKVPAFNKSFTFATGDTDNTRFTVPVVLLPALTKAGTK